MADTGPCRVNGDLVLHSHEVMYRNAVASTSSDTAKDPDAIDYLTSQALPAATAIVDSAADYDDGSHMVDDEAAPEEGLLGQVADGLLSDVTQIGGVIKRRWMKQDDIGPVQTRPRIGLVKLFSQPQVSTAAKNDTLATMSTTAAAIPSTLPANTTSLRDPQASASKSHQMEQIWITPPNAAHKYFPALGNYAAKTNSRPTTFMGMMFGALCYTFTQRSVWLADDASRHVLRRQRPELGESEGTILLLQQRQDVGQQLDQETSACQKLNHM